MRSRFSVVLILLISTTLLVASRPAQAVPVDEPAVPVAGGVTLDGRGFGHGVGMSQYGAQGRAIQGGKAAGILSFYYPGTKLSTGTGEIKVWIRADNDGDLVVVAKKGLQIKDFGTGKAYTLPSIGAVAWKIYPSPSTGKFRVSYQKNGWHPYALGGKASLVGYGEFRSSSYAVTLRTPSGDRGYRGAVQLRPSTTVSPPYKVINRTGLESYVKGVLASEMPSTWRREALKAQAIAARSYALFEKAATPLTDTYHVDDTTSSQVYKGMAGETTTTNEIVAATAGTALKYDFPSDNPDKGFVYAFTQFSASNGGWVAAGSQPYLLAKQDTFEQYAKAPGPWSYSPGQATLQTKLAALAKNPKYPYKTDIGTLLSVQVLTRDGNGPGGGRALTVKLDGSTADVTVSGSHFRTALSLRSTWFTIS